jgi:ELWxxDGT repeat protein
MSSKTGIFLRLVPVCLVLLPAAAAAQGTIGPLQRYFSGGAVMSSARAGSLAFFMTVSPTYPPQPFTLGLVRSDGTFQGTFLIDQSQAGIRFADSLGNFLFFTCAKSSAPEDRGLCRSDGSVAGTFPVTQGLSLALDNNAVEPPLTLSIPEKRLMFFSASPRSASPDFELWATDGTLEGTRLVKDVNPEGSSNPRRMMALGGQLFFFADTPQGRELWRSNGTPEGTERVHDFPKKDSETLDLVQAGGALFIVQDTASGVEVWRSDGTKAGTERVLNLPQQLRGHRAAGRHLFLVARDATPTNEIWAIDGGTGEAVRVLQIETAQEIQLLAVGDHLAFSLEDDHGREPWWSDGTPEGTHRIADLCPGSCSSLGAFSSFAGTYRGRAVLRAGDGVSGIEPWLTDGTAAGTWRLGDFCPGECDSPFAVQEINGWLVLRIDGVVRVSDGTPNGAWKVGDVNTQADWISLPDRLLFFAPALSAPGLIGFLASLPVTAPAPPPGAWLESTRLPGFRVKVQIDGRTAGRQESACMARTLCVSGVVPGRSEVFVRVSEPRPNGRLWLSMIKLTTSAPEVWVLQTATGSLRHYRLNGSDPAGATLPGTIDRAGFLSVPGGLETAIEEARAGRDPQPPGRWIESGAIPGFRIQARLTSNGKSRVLRNELCVAETFCLSGATPGVAELLVRVAGPKPNRYFWPMLARFAPATLEVWVQQRSTGTVRYYRLNAPPAGSSQLDGYVDRQGFRR